jgi:site-specific recombinase XerD
MTELRQRMIQDMKIRNYSPRTIEAYTRHVACFAGHFGRSPDQLGPEEIRQYQVYLVEQKKASWSAFNQAVCALRFLYGTTLRRPWPVTMIPFGKKPKTLPAVLGPEEVQRLLGCAYPLKQRVILTVLYAAGLRLDEALHLEVRDIDAARMLLRVACGKGAKERLVPMSPRLLECLRDYWRKYRVKTWLFPGSNPDRPLNPSAVQSACRRAAAEAGLTKRITPHCLRHSYATGLLEAGVDLLTIGRLLGHACFSSTLIYLHVRRPHLQSAPSPLDWLPVKPCPSGVEPSSQTPSSETSSKRAEAAGPGSKRSPSKSTKDATASRKGTKRSKRNHR